jgi:group I intron endonuclease
MNYSVYKITNKVNGKCYVGLTKKSPEMRMFEHYKRGFALTAAIDKYGSDNFELFVLDSGLTKELAVEREKYWIQECQSTVDKHGYNMTLGGDGVVNVILTEESRRRYSEAAKKGYRENPNYGNTGKKRSDESKEKMRNADYLLKRIGANNPMFGRKHSEESLKKMRNRKKL